jgi:hypothetical protein
MSKLQNISFLGSIQLILLGLLSAGLVYYFWNKKDQKRKGLKIALHVLLILSLLNLLFPFSWYVEAKSGKIIVAKENVPTEVINRISDSLKTKAIFTESEIKSRIKENADWLKNIGQVYVVGNDFETKFLSDLVPNSISFIPYFEKDSIQNLKYPAVAQQGEAVEVWGKIANIGTLTAKSGNTTLDSILTNGNVFRLSFPVLGIGRNEFELFFNQKPIETLEIFSFRPKPLNVLMLLENPDFESKTLANWLAKNGHTVEIKTQVAKDIKSSTKINKPAADFDLLVIHPSDLRNAITKSFSNQNKSVLVMGLNNPADDLPNINKNLGTAFSIKKISSESEIETNERALAFPYLFDKNNRVKTLNGELMAAENQKIGVSLYSETYPLYLSGDSLGYANIWQKIIRQIYPSQKDIYDIKAPIIRGLSQKITLVNATKSVDKLVTPTKDTLLFTQSEFYESIFEGSLSFQKQGWQKLNDSLEVFVTNKKEYAEAKRTSEYVNSFAETVIGSKAERIEKEISLWWRFAFAIFIFGFIWLEQKL